MHLSQHKLRTRKAKLVLEKKFYLDLPGYPDMALKLARLDFTYTKTAVRALKLARLDFTYTKTAVRALKLARLDFTYTKTAVRALKLARLEDRAYPTRRRSSGGALGSCCRRLVQPWSTIRSPRPTSSPWPPGRDSGAEWRRRYRPPEDSNTGLIS